MTRLSPDAERIMALPHVRHPQLVGTCRQLAATPNVNLADAVGILASLCTAARISTLDIEMLQPDAVIAVPFAPPSAGPAEDHQQRVAHHVRQLTLHRGGKA